MDVKMTNTKRPDKLSKSGEKKLWALLDALPAGIFLLAASDRRLLGCNKQFASMFGYHSREECLAQYAAEKHFLEPGLFQRNLGIANDTDEPVSFQAAMKRRDGAMSWAACSLRLNRDAGCFEGVATDSTCLKIELEGLRKSEGLYRRLAENATDVIWIADMDLKFTFISPFVKRQRGYTVEEAMAQSWDEMFTPASAESVARVFSEEMALEAAPKSDPDRWRTMEAELMCKDGSTIWAEINASFLRDPQGRATGVIGITRDITQRKRNEEELRRAHSEITLLLASIPSVLIHVDEDMRIAQWNGAAARTLGLEASEVVGLHLEDCGTSWDWEAVRKGVADSHRESQPVPLGDMPFEHKDGRDGFLEVTINPVTKGDGSPGGFILLGTDVTERRKAELALKRSMSSLAEAQRIAHLGNWDWDVANDQVFWSDEVYRILGLEPREFPGTYEGFLRSVHPDDRESVTQAVYGALRENKPYSIEHRVVLPSGEIGFVHEEGEVTFDDSGKPIRMVGTMHEITESKRSQEALARSERELGIMNWIANVFLTTPDEQMYDKVLEAVLDATSSKHGLFGYVSEDDEIVFAGMAGEAWNQCAMPNKRLVFRRDEWGGIWGRAMIEKKVLYSNEPLHVPEGHIPMARAVTAPIVHKGELIGAITVGNKPTDYDEADRELLESISKYIAPILDARLERDAEERACRLAQAEKSKMQLQLLQAHKLESVGQLASGIAHEINTPTQYIGDNTSFLQQAFNDLGRFMDNLSAFVKEARTRNILGDLVNETEALAQEIDLEFLREEIPKALGECLEGVQRVSGIVAAMKEFSHPGAGEKQPADLNKAIESTVTVSRNEWKYVAETVLDLDPSLPQVPCLEGDIKQVLLNLIVNASHAIADVVGDGSDAKGTITVTTRAEDEWVEIRVTDTGTGIPDEAKSKVFDPFFTTKQVGKGTGQGLAIARSAIVDRHNGTITLETEVGRGTTFIIRLPLQVSLCGGRDNEHTNPLCG
jgi:PAS domain S-box-containing protein